MNVLKWKNLLKSCFRAELHGLVTKSGRSDKNGRSLHEKWAVLR